MRIFSLLLGATLATAPLSAQSVSDVGLMMDGGILTVIYGQDCGPFTCQPFQAGPTGAGQPYNVYVFGAPLQFFALAADLETNQPCVTIAGLGNSLLLQQPITLAFGSTGQLISIGLCQQSRATYVLQFPLGTPVGIGFRLQALTLSASQGVAAFTVAIRSVTA